MMKGETSDKPLFGKEEHISQEATFERRVEGHRLLTRQVFIKLSPFSSRKRDFFPERLKNSCGVRGFWFQWMETYLT
ncbi:hypothetical protein GCM10011571_29910 [Marinithermofilum abyssi]|uniref:Uncharacterized protein n=1 Tax=Marinithermofilum abyssi TaxID=1571185 RepID=A0A8J2YB06_9BACL|nr:hypothetical protein GCM10011571_29910 [Marinithermofilum abyssi]